MTLLAEFPDARGVGIDPSRAALDVARTNAAHLDVTGRASWFEGRFDSFLAAENNGFSLIISNPPYIPTSEIAGLDRDVRDFDPHLALDGGPDGLEIYRSIIAGLPRVISSGWVLLEIGHTQGDQVSDIKEKSLNRSHVEELLTISDMAGKPRCVAFALRANASQK